MIIEIDDDNADKIIEASLRMHVDILRKDIKRLKKLRTLQPVQIEDLEYYTRTLTGLEIALDFYSTEGY